MTLASPKGSQTMAHQKSLLSIAASIGGLAMFLMLGSVVLVSQPIGSTVRGYFYSIDYSRRISTISRANETVIDSHHDNLGNFDLAMSGANEPLSESQHRYTDINDLTKANLSRSSNSLPVDKIDKKQPYEKPFSLQGDKEAVNSSGLPIISSTRDMADQLAPMSTLSSGLTQEEKATEGSVSSKGTGDIENAKPPSLRLPDKSTIIQTGSHDGNPISSYSKMEGAPTLPPVPGNRIQSGSVYSDCDLEHGKWVYDSTGPLYTNGSCPVLTQMQNCQGNGRPDKEYENWRWKPAQCDLPRFDAKNFLELMRGKTLAFIGDSVARNQMESMLCILWQVEVPKNRGNKRMQRYYFKSTSTMIVRIWSSWLVRKTWEPFDFAPEGVDKLHLDAPDDNFMEFIPNFDVIVLSSGHWFAKQSVYILNNQIVGGQLWWPDNSKPKKINNVEAFGISVETILTAIGTHPNYTGLTIVRSYSPDHYEGGAWNTGGSCTGKVRPILDGQLVENGFTNIMHEKQVTGFNRAINKTTNKSKLRLMDITEAFGYRHDGHPGPYRSPDPNKITKRGPDGKPPPQDCLHWCMPGPIDTWNELVLEIIRREFDGSQTLPS